MNKHIFQSRRLGFRSWQNADIFALFEMNADTEVMQYFEKPMSLEESKNQLYKMQSHFNDYGFTYFAVETLADGQFIGMIGMAHKHFKSRFTPAVDIGWRLKKEAWGMGYATEGAKRCMDYAFGDLSLDRLISICVIDNAKSENVMKKIGMKKIGEFDHPQVLNRPDLVRHLCYEMKKDYRL